MTHNVPAIISSGQIFRKLLLIMSCHLCMGFNCTRWEVSSISSITSIELFSEEGIIHHLGEGFYQHKIPLPQVILYSIYKTFHYGSI